MITLPTPILIFGDEYICKNNIRDAKKKYKNFTWEVLNIEKTSLEELRFHVSFLGFGVENKIVLLLGLPTLKDDRESLLRIMSETIQNVFLIVCDSNNEIKIDPKTKTFNKTWGDFLKKFNEIPNCKLINNGEAFTDKQSKDCCEYVKELFNKKGKEIGNDVCQMFVNIVGMNKGLILTEVERLIIIAPSKITLQFVLDNTYPSSQEAILYKFSNVIDTGDYNKSIIVLEQFLDSGVNSNVLVEIMAKKARWQLAAASLWKKGLSWNKIDEKLMEMGKFPSNIWHKDDISFFQKKKLSEGFDSVESIIQYMSKEKGLPSEYFKQGKKKKSTECLPMAFMAKQITMFLQEKIINTNRSIPNTEIKDRVLDRCIKTYIKVIYGLKQIRYDINNKAELFNMVAALVDNRI